MGQAIKNKSETATHTHQFPFLANAGEMGTLIETKNWNTTSLGPIDTWPQSLKTALSILLHSKFPKFLFWGPELICFYNDAFRPSLGVDGKHPNILGSPGEEYWGEIWDIIKPLIDQVMSGGEATWSEDQLIPFYRNGAIENIYWTFSYSPLTDESGEVAGVWVTCMETTEKVNTLKELEESKKQLEFTIDSANLATWSFDMKSYTFRSNDRLKEWYKLDDEVNPSETGIERLHPQDKSRILEATQRSLNYESGGKFDEVFRIINPSNDEIKTLRSIGRTWFDDNKEPYQMYGIVLDITEQAKIENENKKLSAIVSKSNEFIGAANMDEEAEYINPAGLKMLGWDDYKGRTISDCIYEEDLPKARKLLNSLMHKQSLSDEIRLFNEKTGKPFWIKWNIFPIRDEFTNDLLNLATTSVNIDELKRNEVAVREALNKIEESEKRFRKVANSAPVMIKMTDATGRINFVNKMWQEFTGVQASDYIGQKALQRVHPDDHQAAVSLYKSCVKRREEFRAEYRVRMHDDSYRWLSNIGVPRFTVDGSYEGYIHACMDVHDIKLQEQQKDMFIGMASHELKTPVTSIKGYAQILKKRYEDSEDEFLLNSLSIIDNQIRVVTNLISELLDLSKMTTGGLDLHPERFALCELITEVIKETTLINPKYEISYKPGNTSEVVADKERIRQVLNNLLNNAVKYSPDSRRIEVRSEFTQSTATVYVKDFGIGINKVNQDKVFNRFYREQGKNEKTFPGFGIGLYISSEIIKKHQGTIAVTSEKGEGSEFHFSIPIEPSNM